MDHQSTPPLSPSCVAARAPDAPRHHTEALPPSDGTPTRSVRPGPASTMGVIASFPALYAALSAPLDHVRHVQRETTSLPTWYTTSIESPSAGSRDSLRSGTSTSRGDCVTPPASKPS